MAALGQNTRHDEQNMRERDEKLKQDKRDTNMATVIAKYFKKTCDLCSVRLQTIDQALRHYRSVHQVPGYLRCCGKKLNDRTQVKDHVQWHNDPNVFK